MDNCEHVVEACAWMVESLTRRAPALTVLATSREPLGVAGEKVWRVPPLDEASAVQLFEQRARQRGNAFAVTPENASTVRAICTRLDYIPLAIELAAPRVALIPPDQILERLDQRFQLRHPTIRSAHDPHRVHSLQPGGRGARPLRRPARPGHWCATQSRALDARDREPRVVVEPDDLAVDVDGVAVEDWLVTHRRLVGPLDGTTQAEPDQP